MVITFLFLFSCKKEPNEKQNDSNVNTLTDEIDKVVTIYQEGDIKIENIDPDLPKIETSAPESYKEKIRHELENSYSKQTNYLKSSGNMVGIIRSGTCGAYHELKLQMDCEDSRPATKKIGSFTGDCLVDAYRNIVLRICMVDGAYFVRTNHSYAVLNLSPNSLPIGVTRVIRLFDNEDSPNSNVLYVNDNQVSLPSTIGECNFSHDTMLGFYYYPADPNSTASFPNLGFTYGVFGNWSSNTTDKGQIFSDDEDLHNANYLYQQTWNGNILNPIQYISSIPSVIEASGENTNIYFNRVN